MCQNVSVQRWKRFISKPTVWTTSRQIITCKTNVNKCMQNGLSYGGFHTNENSSMHYRPANSQQCLHVPSVLTLSRLPRQLGKEL